MRKKLVIALLAVSLYTSAQTSDKKNNISIGGGKESYNGDLGNSWFNPEEEWYGFVNASYSRYLNKSFDVSISVTSGDFGHCRDSDDPAVRPDGSKVLNMLSRLTTGIVSAKYKFANGYILKEQAKLAPFIYAGIGINNVTDYWWADKSRVNAGNYGSVNAGLGLRYNFYKNFNFTYTIGVGYFLTDKIDYRVQGINDMYLQNNFAVGINF
jgi:opacity protein-like surface antigen